MDLQKSFPASHSLEFRVFRGALFVPVMNFRNVAMAYLNSTKLLTGMLTGCQFQMVLAPWDSWSL